MPDQDKCVGEVEVDMVEEFNKSGWYIRVRCRKVWRVNAALMALRLAVFLARMLGVGIRIVPDGQLVVPHHKLTKLVEENREDIWRAELAKAIGANHHDS